MRTFVRREWRWALLLPVFMLLGTELHESAHAVVALACGATHVELWVLPRIDSYGVLFGSIHYEDVPRECHPLVAVAPLVAAHLHALLGSVTVPRLGATFLGRLLFFTSVLLPLFDASMAYGGLAFSHTSDLADFSALPFVIAGGPAFAFLLWRAWCAFRVPFGPPTGLGPRPFFALLALTLGLPWLRFVLHVTA